MNKLVIAGALALAIALPMAASAASIPNIKFDNGQTTRDCTAGQQVNFVARITVPAGEVVEKVQVDVISDLLAPELAKDVGGDLGLQEGQHDVNLTAPCPQNTGYYTVEVRTSGVFGGMRSNSITDGVTSVASFGSALRVVASAAPTTGSGPAVGSTQWTADLIAMIKAALAPAPAPVPVVNAKCDAIKPYLTAPSETYSALGVQLQSALLLDNPYAIPALKPGSSVPMGYRGVQTNAALSAYLSTYRCN